MIQTGTDDTGGARDALSADAVDAGIKGILDTIDVPIIVVDRDCKVVRFNQATAAALGLTSLDLGQLPCNIRALADLKDLEKLCARVITDGAPYGCEVRNGDRWFLLRIAPCAGSDRQVAGAVLTLANVTAFRESIGRAIYEREYTKAILNTVIEPLVVLDSDLRVQTANRAFYAMFGVSREESHGVPLHDLGGHDWKTAGLWPSLQAILSDRREFDTVEIECAFPIGRRTLLLDVRRLSQDGDAGNMILLALRDVTGRKKAEEKLAQALRRQEALYQFVERRHRARSVGEIYDAALDAILSVLGCQRVAILLLDGSAVVRFAAWRGLSEAYRKAVEGHSPWNSEDLDPRPVCVSDTTGLKDPLKSAVAAEGIGALAFIPLVVNRRLAGKLMIYYNAPHDFSDEELELSVNIAIQLALGIERKRVEEALRESEAKARRLLELNQRTMNNMGEGLYTVDVQGLVTYVNPEAERLFGWKFEELRGRRLHDMIHYKRPDGSPFPIEECSGFQVLQEGKVLKDFEDTFIRKDGTFFPVSHSSSPLWDSDAGIVGLVIVFQDITERKRAEEALRAGNQELARFNRVMVDRETRMIELKKEINELLERQGDAPRYGLQFEQSEDEPPSIPVTIGGEGLAPLESILRTEQLNQRPERAPDHESENRALTALVQSLADSRRTILQTLVEKVLECLQADSAGLSLLTKDQKSFSWAAIAGAWQPHIGGGTPRDFGPCGDVLDYNMPMLFTHWERRYPYLAQAMPLAEEGLLVPFYVAGKAVGTIWAIAHNDRRKFDTEDLRLLESLGRFASAAYQVVELRHIEDARRAALNLMEDALSARQTAEHTAAALREREERYQLVVAGAEAAIWDWDVRAKRVFFSPRWKELRGLRDDEVSDTEEEWSSGIHADDIERIMAAVRAHFDGRTSVFSEEYRVRHKNGHWIWLLARGIARRDAAGRVIRMAGSETDITRRKEAEEMLRKFTVELEGLVEKRTAEAQEATRALLRDMEERQELEAQLLQAQKMESIGTLAGGIAHDFNNILNIIQSHASLLDGASAEEKAQYLEIVDKSIRRGAGVVQQLLTLARKGGVQLQSTDLNRIMDDLAKLLRETLPKTIRVTWEQTEHLPPIMANPNQITQALLNLCLNARDSMPQGGELTLRVDVADGKNPAEPCGPARRYARIEIIDTGTGMDQAVQSRMFEPFFTTKEVDQGTGLGLSVVYGIVKNHQGFIRVDSQPGHGTAFQLWFPVAHEEETMELFPPDASKSEKFSERRTILIVEDEVLMLQLLEKRLSQHGYEVLSAADGEQAIDLFRAHRQNIDAVLLDVGLPKISGWQVFQKMKEEDSQVKVVVASGYLDPELKAKLSQSGVGHMIYKPYQLDEVIDQLRSLTQRDP